MRCGRWVRLTTAALRVQPKLVPPFALDATGGWFGAREGPLTTDACSHHGLLLIRQPAASPSHCRHPLPPTPPNPTPAGAWAAGTALSARPSLFAAATLTVASLTALSCLALDHHAPSELGRAEDRDTYLATAAWCPYETLLPGTTTTTTAAVAAAAPPGVTTAAPAPPAATAATTTVTITAAAAAEGGGPSGAGEALVRLVRARGTFPPVLLRAGLQDGAVGYWEMAKYAARLRDVHALFSGDALPDTLPGVLPGALPGTLLGTPEANSLQDGNAEGAGVARCARGLVLLTVKLGGHTCYGTSEDEGVKLAFLMSALGQA